jgi:SAM-dependent methyltransferase
VIAFKINPDIEKIVWQPIEEATEKYIPSAWSCLLDAGGGTGSRTIRYANGRRRITCLDISEEAIKKGKGKFKDVAGYSWIVGDMTKLPFRDDCFDVVFCSSALHHVTKPETAADEICRVLRPGGKIILREPGILSPLALVARTFFRTREHVPYERPFIPSALKDLIRRRFTDVEVKYFGTLTYALPFVFARLQHVPKMVKKIIALLVLFDNEISKKLKWLSSVIVIKARKQ